MKAVVRAMATLAPDFVLAPERYVALAHATDGVPLGDLVKERSVRVEPSPEDDVLILDTSHARDGIVDVARALRDPPSSRSGKKRALAGDLVCSRLRPYLRQLALVHPAMMAALEGRRLAVSTEFYVLGPREKGEEIAFLIPFFLSFQTQQTLADAQEGGHHPRVPRSSLLAMKVPHALVKRRAATSRAVMAALAAYYDATFRLRALIDPRV